MGHLFDEQGRALGGVVGGHGITGIAGVADISEIDLDGFTDPTGPGLDGFLDTSDIVLAPISPTSNPPTDDVVADAGPLRLPVSIQALNLPPGVLIGGAVLTAALIIFSVVQARARKRIAQAKGIAGFFRRIRGK